LDADLGLMISASHNPYFDNGIKIFNSQGFKLKQCEEIQISALTLDGCDVSCYLSPGKRFEPIQFMDGARIYSQSLFKSLPTSSDISGLRARVDCANGATSQVFPRVLSLLGVSFEIQAHRPDGFNINENCGALYPQGLARGLRDSQANLGIALDGDGDRCVLLDEFGKVLSGDEVLGICALDLKSQNQLNPPMVVSTVLSNIGLEMALYGQGISLVRTPVGDRNVVEQLLERRCVLGGESSGHFIFMNHGTTGDGILSAIQVLAIMARTGVPLSELRKSIQLFPQVMIDVPVKQKTPFSSHHEITEVITSVESALQNRGRVLVRYSGTESVARVMLEGEDLHRIRFFCDQIAATLERHLNL
jgi:phosphoglucosamine mutase